MAQIHKTKNGRSYIILANGRARFVKSSRKTNTTKVFRMARRKRSFKSYAKKGMNNQYVGLFAAGLYGAVRQRISNALTPVTNKIPLGNISDEVGIGLTLILAKKAIKNPMFTKVANAGLTIEAARIGEAVANGQLGIGMSSNTSSDSAW